MVLWVNYGREAQHEAPRRFRARCVCVCVIGNRGGQRLLRWLPQKLRPMTPRCLSIIDWRLRKRPTAWTPALPANTLRVNPQSSVHFGDEWAIHMGGNAVQIFNHTTSKRHIPWWQEGGKFTADSAPMAPSIRPTAGEGKPLYLNGRTVVLGTAAWYPEIDPRSSPLCTPCQRPAISRAPGPGHPDRSGSVLGRNNKHGTDQKGAALDPTPSRGGGPSS